MVSLTDDVDVIIDDFLFESSAAVPDVLQVVQEAGERMGMKSVRGKAGREAEGAFYLIGIGNDHASEIVLCDLAS